MQFSFNYNSLTFILLIVFLVCLVIQLVYHWGFFSKVAFYKRNARPKLDEELEPVSIVLCARDAYEYLVELIPALLKQDYPNFEIVVVNDCSDDDTEEYLKDLERKESRVKPVQLKQHLNFFNGKKFPLLTSGASPRKRTFLRPKRRTPRASASWERWTCRPS